MKSNSEAIFVFPGCDGCSYFCCSMSNTAGDTMLRKKKPKDQKTEQKSKIKQNKTKQSETTTSVSYGASPKYPHTKKY